MKWVGFGLDSCGQGLAGSCDHCNEPVIFFRRTLIRGVTCQILFYLFFNFLQVMKVCWLRWLSSFVTTFQIQGLYMQILKTL